MTAKVPNSVAAKSKQKPGDRKAAAAKTAAAKAAPRKGAGAAKPASSKAPTKPAAKAVLKPVSKSPKKPVQKPAAKAGAAAQTGAARGASIQKPGQKAPQGKAPVVKAPATKTAAAKAPAGKAPAGKAPPQAGKSGAKGRQEPARLSPLALTPPPPPPPRKSPSRGKGITIIEPKRQAAKSAESGKAPKGSRKSTPKIDLANARSVAAVAITAKADSHGYVVVNGRRVRMISTKGAPTRKAVKPVAVKPAQAFPTEQTIKGIRTKLGKKELDHYREILLQHRRELVGRVTGLEDEALRSSGGNLSTMPLHPADIGTDTFDQDFALGMAASDRQLLAEIDGAIDRIEDKTYGVCQMTGKPIPKARLDAKPWAKYTVEAARLVESGQHR